MGRCGACAAGRSELAIGWQAIVQGMCIGPVGPATSGTCASAHRPMRITGGVCPLPPALQLIYGGREEEDYFDDLWLLVSASGPDGAGSLKGRLPHSCLPESAAAATSSNAMPATMAPQLSAWRSAHCCTMGSLAAPLSTPLLESLPSLSLLHPLRPSEHCQGPVEPH